MLKEEGSSVLISLLGEALALPFEDEGGTSAGAVAAACNAKKKRSGQVSSAAKENHLYVGRDAKDDHFLFS